MRTTMRLRYCPSEKNAQRRRLAAQLVLGVVQVGEVLDLGDRQEAGERRAERQCRGSSARRAACRRPGPRRTPCAARGSRRRRRPSATSSPNTSASGRAASTSVSAALMPAPASGPVASGSRPPKRVGPLRGRRLSTSCRGVGPAIGAAMHRRGVEQLRAGSGLGELPHLGAQRPRSARPASPGVRAPRVDQRAAVASTGSRASSARSPARAVGDLGVGAGVAHQPHGAQVQHRRAALASGPVGQRGRRREQLAASGPSTATYRAGPRRRGRARSSPRACAR